MVCGSHEPWPALLSPRTVQHLSARLAQKDTVHPVFDPSLGSGKVRRLLSLLPRRAQGSHYIVKHHPLNQPIACNGRKLSDRRASLSVAVALGISAIGLLTLRGLV